MNTEMNVVVMLIFLVLSALALGAALMVVLVRNLIHAALWLIATFFAVGALYLLMEAEFLGVVQILVYVGAISILILFAIMLTRNIDQGQQFYRRWWLGLVAAGLLFGVVLAPTLLGANWSLTNNPQMGIAGVPELGRALVSEYLIAFELAGLLLLVGAIGAIVIALEERRSRRRVLTLAEEYAARNQEPKAEALGEQTKEP